MSKRKDSAYRPLVTRVGVVSSVVALVQLRGGALVIMPDLELQPESVGCRMQGSQKGLSNGTGRVDKHGNDGGHRQQFVRKIILHI